MKKTILATTAFLAVIGSTMAASAAPYHKISPRERAEIAQSRAHLNAVKRAAYADGRVTMFERAKIRMAQHRLDRAIANARKY